MLNLNCVKAPHAVHTHARTHARKRTHIYGIAYRGVPRGFGYRCDAETTGPKLIIKNIINLSSRTSATSQFFTCFSFKTVFRRSQRQCWSFSVTRVANIALSKSFFVLFVAERSGARTTPLSLSAMLPKCQHTEQVVGVRASILRSRDKHLINIRQSKLRLAKSLWFHAIKTSRNIS